MCGCVTSDEIMNVYGRNVLGTGTFVVTVMGERQYAQEYNPYAFSHTSSLAQDNRNMLNSLMNIESRLEERKDDPDAERILPFVRECEKIILYSKNDEIPNEAALSIDIKLKGYDRVCVIDVLEQSEMERVFSPHLVELTFQEYIHKCMDFSSNHKYHMYLLEGWMVVQVLPVRTAVHLTAGIRKGYPKGSRKKYQTGSRKLLRLPHQKQVLQVRMQEYLQQELREDLLPEYQQQVCLQFQ